MFPLMSHQMTVYLLHTLLCKLFFLLLSLLHALQSSLVPPAKERRCVHIGMSVILIVTDLRWGVEEGGGEGGKEEGEGREKERKAV